MRSASETSWPGLSTTTACTLSPHFSLGIPITAHDEDEAFIVHVGTVTRMHPAVAQGTGVVRRAVPVAHHGRHAACGNLAYGSAWQFLAILTHDLDLGQRPRPPGGTQLAQ